MMIEFEYKGFWIESTPFNQAENGHSEEGFTYTSYIYWSKEERDALEDPIEALIEVYFSPTELVLEVPHAIDKFMRKNKIKR